MTQLKANANSGTFLTLKDDIEVGIASLQDASQELVASGADAEEVQIMLEECMAAGSDATGLGDLESNDINSIVKNCKKEMRQMQRDQDEILEADEEIDEQLDGTALGDSVEALTQMAADTMAEGLLDEEVVSLIIDRCMKMGFVDEDGDGENDVIATCQADIEDAITKQEIGKLAGTAFALD
jgi:hypothetical protein